MKPTISHPKQSVQVKKVTQVSVSEMHIGPLPSPEQLGKYEEVQPGFAHEIMEMAKKEQDARLGRELRLIELEEKMVQRTNWNIIRGQFLAFFSVVVTSGLCAYFAVLGDIPTAGQTARWVIASLAAVFITGRFKQLLPPTKNEE